MIESLRGKQPEFKRGSPQIDRQTSDEAERHQIREAEIAETRQLYQDLLKKAEAAGNTPKDRQHLKQEFVNFAEEHLGWFPSNFSTLPLNDRLHLAVAFSRIPEAQGTVSQVFVGDLSYALTFAQENIGRTLADQIKPLSVEDQIDSTLYLSTVCADALAQGYAEQGVKAIKKTLNYLESEAERNPFLKYALRQTLQEIGSEEEEPTRGVVIRTGDRSVGRRGGVLTDEDVSEMKLFARKIQPEGKSTQGNYLRVARDAVAIVDHSLFPQSIALTAENFEASGESDAQYDSAEELLTFIKTSRRTPAAAIPKALFYADQHLLPEATPRTEAWHNIHPDSSPEEWSNFWELYEEYNAIIQERDQLVYDEQTAAEQSNLQASREFIRLAKEATRHIPSGPPYTALVEGLSSDDPETQFRYAEELAMIARYQPDAPAAILDIAQLAQEIQDLHRQNFDQARQNSEAIFEEYQEPLTLRHSQLSPYFDKFKHTNLLASLTKHAESLLRNDDRVKIEFKSYEEIVPAGKVHIGEQEKTSDISLLLQEIHRPAIRRGLEKDLGVPLRELSVREQLQLVPFLAQAEPEKQQRVFTLTQKFGVSAAQAFLSGEYGENFFTAVLNIGEQKDLITAQNVFDRYAEISTIAQDAVNEIAEASLQGTTKKLDPQILQREILTQAKKLLETVAKPGTPTEDVEAALEAAKTETVLFASICKTYFKNNPDGRLEDVKGVALETQKSGHVSPLDQEKMVEMLRKNWLEKPQVANSLTTDLQNKLVNPEAKANFYILKKEGRLLGFLSFSEGHPDAPDGVYGDSFNIDPDINKSGLGTALLSDVIDKESSQHPVYTHADPNSPAFKLFTERFKFEQIGSEKETMSDGSTVIWAKLRRFDQAS